MGSNRGAQIMGKWPSRCKLDARSIVTISVPVRLTIPTFVIRMRRGRSTFALDGMNLRPPHNNVGHIMAWRAARVNSPSVCPRR